MAQIRPAVVSIALACGFAVANAGGLPAAEFSAEATALPFPPDARELEFVAWAGDINYKSNSPLKSLAAFYLKEMASRGWEHDESAAAIEDDSIKLTFKHDKSKVELSLTQSSKEVHVSLDCEKLKFTGTDDPAKLVAAGISVPRAVVFLQKELPLPPGAVNVQYTAEGCTFKSPLKLQEAFDHFTKLIPAKGFRESRRPITTDSRRYTEFKKGAAQLSVNVFTDAVGSRVILEYKDDAKEAPVPPLAAVASLPIKIGGGNRTAAGDPAAPPVDATPIDVASNKGSATVSYTGKQYTFASVAAFQTKSDASNPNSATVVFAAKPIAYNKMQSLIATKNSFSFGDLYELGWPDHLIVQVSEHPSFSFAGPGVSISASLENPSGEMKVVAGRVQGTLKMPPKDVFSGEKFSFTATMDAVIITPSTRISGPADPVARSDSPTLADAPVGFPEPIENAGREGSKFRKKYTALIAKPMAEVDAFFRQELTAKGWKPPLAESTGEIMRFKNEKLEFSLELKPQRGKTAVEILTRDIALARQEGIVPEPGKGRLILGNANNVAVVFTVGNASYSLKPGQGAKDYKQAVNQSLAPGTYTVVVKVQGQQPQTEKIELAEGSTWGIVALPMGGSLPVQLY